jgi:hypothetical protein
VGVADLAAITLSWTDWRRIIATLRAHGLPSMLDHANLIEEWLEMHAPSEVTVTLSLNDDVYHRSSNWARWQLAIPLAPESLP